MPLLVAAIGRARGAAGVLVAPPPAGVVRAPHFSLGSAASTRGLTGRRFAIWWGALFSALDKG
uniref:Uncharacterized protein n=1 Tax=Arundo donax TaxID=35708 RepID=A0A0A9BNC6_ARUDO